MLRLWPKLAIANRMTRMLALCYLVSRDMGALCRSLAVPEGNLMACTPILLGVLVGDMIIGSLFIAGSLLDIFQTLFHPAGRGALSDWTAKTVWRIFRRAACYRRGILTYAGPFSILCTIVSWAALTWFGFALIYLPLLEAGFSYDAGVAAVRNGGLLEALNLSVGTLITLSQGATPKLPYLRLLCGFEAIVGFGLLTASVSWLLSIYPVLESRRSLAERATLLHNAERETAVDIINETRHAPDWLLGFASDLANLRNQMAQFPIVYYFHFGEKQTALSGVLAYILDVADHAAQSQEPPMRLAGTALGGAVHNFLNLLATDFLRISSEDKWEVLRAYARNQMNEVTRRQPISPSSRAA
jgi:hypothetical protein